MKNFKERKPMLAKPLAVILLVLLCYLCYRVGEELLFWTLCKRQDRNIPPNTEILVSACKEPSAIGVPGGEVLFVREDRTNKTYLLDLRGGEKKDVPNDPLLLDHGIFLSSELVWLEGSSKPGASGYRPHYILDLIDGQRYELLDLTWLPLLNDNKFHPRYYAYFQSAEQIFIDHSKNTLVALSPNFRQHPEGNVVFSQYSLESGSSAKKGELLEQLTKNLGVDYEIVDFSLKYTDVPSPTGRYIVRGDGIYLSEANTPVVTRDMGWYFRGWYYDESGVAFKEAGYDLIDFGPDFGGGYYYIPTPILKLRLPVP